MDDRHTETIINLIILLITVVLYTEVGIALAATLGFIIYLWIHVDYDKVHSALFGDPPSDEE